MGQNLKDMYLENDTEDDVKALVIRSSSDDVRKQLLFNLPTLLRIVYRLHFNVPILCNVM